jgi:protein associated with RNAse G/E
VTDQPGYRLVSVRADGSPHRMWPCVVATEDPWSFIIPSRSPVVEADGKRWHSDYPVVAVFWPDRWYQLFVLLKPAGIEYYCNVIAPPVYEAGSRTVRFVDLDLDVYVDRQVRVLDEEEFAARSIYYPPEWRDAADAAAAELVRLAQDRAGPFHPAAAERWRRLAEAWGSGARS